MAVIRKVTRVSNPRKRYRRAKGLRNRKGQFVKRGRAARMHKRHTRRKKNSSGLNLKTLSNQIKRLKSDLTGGKRRASGTRRRHHRRTTRKRNPVLIELAPAILNPRRRKKHVAKTKRSNRRRRHSNPRRRHVRATRRVHRRRRRNPGPPAWAKAYGFRARGATPVRRNRRHRRRTNRRHYSRRRNPAIFGRSGGKDLLMMVGGGLVGVAATKYLPTLIPASITTSLGTSSFMSIAITGAGAFVAGWLARRFVSGEFGDAVLFGGLMQTGSAVLNAFAPASIAGRLALSGVGDIQPGMFVVPQNPIRDYRPPVAAGVSGMGNLRRFGTFR